MKRFSVLLAIIVAAAVALPVSAQIFKLSREDMIKYTSKNPFERSPDGRPKVPDALLEKMKGLTCEEVFGVLQGKRFINQYEGNWQLLHPGMKLIGRAMTAQFMPTRPDVNDVIEADAKAAGGRRGPNQRVIDLLEKGDVLVVDLFGKTGDQSTYVGDNLATAIFALSGNGFVINGGIRDLEGISPIPMAAYFKGVHPSAIGNVMLTGVNVPVRIGDAVVMPGDVVFGDKEGLYFVPPQFVEAIIKQAEETHIHDEWTKMKLMTGKYKSSELYGKPDDPALIKEYEEYKKQRLGK